MVCCVEQIFTSTRNFLSLVLIQLSISWSFFFREKDTLYLYAPFEIYFCWILFQEQWIFLWKEISRRRFYLGFFWGQDELFKIERMRKSKINYSLLNQLFPYARSDWSVHLWQKSSPSHFPSPCCGVDGSPKMSLLLLLKTCSNLRGRSDRIARVTFRGMLLRNFLELAAVNGLNAL